MQIKRQRTQQNTTVATAVAPIIEIPSEIQPTNIPTQPLIDLLTTPPNTPPQSPRKQPETPQAPIKDKERNTQIMSKLSSTLEYVLLRKNEVKRINESNKFQECFIVKRGDRICLNKTTTEIKKRIKIESAIIKSNENLNNHELGELFMFDLEPFENIRIILNHNNPQSYELILDIFAHYKMVCNHCIEQVAINNLRKNTKGCVINYLKFLTYHNFLYRFLVDNFNIIKETTRNNFITFKEYDSLFIKNIDNCLYNLMNFKKLFDRIVLKFDANNKNKLSFTIKDSVNYLFHIMAHNSAQI